MQVGGGVAVGRGGWEAGWSQPSASHQPFSLQEGCTSSNNQHKRGDSNHSRQLPAPQLVPGRRRWIPPGLPQQRSTGPCPPPP